MATRGQVDELKRSWASDPIWDLAETEGYEAYKEELQSFQEEQETIWAEEKKEKEWTIGRKAQRLGVEGLYRLILKQNELLDRQERAIEHLIHNRPEKAFQALSGVDK